MATDPSADDTAVVDAPGTDPVPGGDPVPGTDPVPGGEPLVIVCAYPDGMLASSWFRAYTRLKRTVTRGGYGARVELAPVSGLPPRIDVLIVPPSLADAASAASPAAERAVAPADGPQAWIDGLVERLVADGRLQRAPTPSSAVAVHRGFQAVAERARPAG
jgi:hypothetical protein